MFQLLGAKVFVARLRLWLLMASLTVLALAGAFPASAQVVAQYDFESGAQGWTGFNGASVRVSASAAQSGTQSLLMARLILARKIANIVLIVWKRGVCFDAKYLKPQTA
jgi:hypothetical protein